MLLVTIFIKPIQTELGTLNEAEVQVKQHFEIPTQLHRSCLAWYSHESPTSQAWQQAPIFQQVGGTDRGIRSSRQIWIT